MKIIAFAGPARAGKSECANLLGFYLKPDYMVVRESFALPMRLAWERLASWLTWKNGTLVNRETDPALYRKVMQRWGSSRRQRNPDHWVEYMTGRLMDLNYQEKARYAENTDSLTWRETVVLIDDVRYGNEVDLIHDLDGVVVFVDPKKRIDLTGEWRSHESEALAMGYLTGAYPDETFDHVLKNDKDTTSLFAGIERHHQRWLDAASTTLRVPQHMQGDPFA